jgi:hypothetical protein
MSQSKTALHNSSVSRQYSIPHLAMCPAGISPLQGQACGLISNPSINQGRSQGLVEGGGGGSSDKSGCTHMEFAKYRKTTNKLTSPLINVRRTAHTRCLFWTAVARNNWFSKLYVHASGIGQCFGERYVIKVLILWSWQTRFLSVCILYACIKSLHC